MMVELDDAYREAWTALGEAVVRERFLQREVERLRAAGEEVRQPSADTVGG